MIQKTQMRDPRQKVWDNDDDIVALNIRVVPRGLRRRFKFLCITEERDMTAALLEYMERCVKLNTLHPDLREIEDEPRGPVV
jgi:hypothetical protein